MRNRLTTPLMALAIFLLNLWLCSPMFLPGELPFRGSIEGGYVAMARFVAEHPSPFGWNPLQYCGVPTQFMYVPAVPYVTALSIRLLPHISPELLYRTLVGLMTCLGPVTAFFFALALTGSRRWSFLMAVAYSVLSPSYALFPAVEKDRGLIQLPWRIQVLAKYGEGPHNAGVTLLPLALLAVWKAARSRGYPRILGAALLLAAIPLTNWVAALTLAISAALLLLAAWGDSDFRVWRPLAAAGLAYLLACFWLTPTFIRTIAFNWPADSFAYQLRANQIYLLAGLAVALLLIRVLFRFLRGSFYFCFVTLAAVTFGWIATAFYLYGVDTIPESRRYALEFELFLALALVEGFRLTMRSSNGTVRLCAVGTGIVMLIVGAPQLWAYATQGSSRWLPAPRATTVEYQLAEWLDQHHPQGRVFATGGLRFRMNSWFEIQQVGGGFETGLQNRVPVDLAYRIRTAVGDDVIPPLKALGVEYVVVHGPKSREYYRDVAEPQRFAGILPAVYHLEDDTIYALPRTPLAHLVNEEDLPSSTAPDALARYASALESYPPLAAQWLDSNRLQIVGPAPHGQVVAVPVNAAPGWHATQDGRDIPLGADRLGFLVVHPVEAAAARIELHYGGTTEQRVMMIVSAAAWIAALSALLWGLRPAVSPPDSPTQSETA